MKINKSNIIPFISYLYWERKKAAPPVALLESWQQLDDAAIQEHLQVLFESWGYAPAAADREIALFLARQPGTATTVAPASPIVTESPVIPQQAQPVPPLFERPATTPPPSPPPPPPVYTPPRTYTTNYPPAPAAPRRRSRRGAWSLLFLLLIALAAGVYALYQYTTYQSLKRLYTITDNVAVRDASGDVVGRMDVYGNPARNSYASLRALDNQEHLLPVNGKEYSMRMVLSDSATFRDYLFRRDENTFYVSAAYLTPNKEDYQRYREVFRSINNNAKESNRLSAAYRQVIVGALNAAGNKDLYVANTCNNQNNDLTAVWTNTAKGSKVKVAAAKMSDGQYYLFAGNTETGVYEAPQPLYYKAPNLSDLQPLRNRDLLFKENGSNVYLYQCDGSSTDFFATPDSEGKITSFQWSFDPTRQP